MEKLTFKASSICHFDCLNAILELLLISMHAHRYFYVQFHTLVMENDAPYTVAPQAIKRDITNEKGSSSLGALVHPSILLWSFQPWILFWKPELSPIVMHETYIFDMPSFICKRSGTVVDWMHML